MQSPQYRPASYFRAEKPEIKLYDHKSDPYESVNVTEENPDIVQKLMPLLEKGNTGLLKKIELTEN
ncbi:hypothetical protein OU798_03555 [Prolixibacteraceae bacterium Z1-6]|uniref:N-sulphoglucosamine sulphohydrolase C-terminal domain-containing protein n=1 Tax=Draconibacterium aestuarii TaxID=2998507 RepID=A0A9X3J692_9BACT|nr:hypothetical protein [Prolixibacteraceae bacterium Z1-6]